MAKIVIYAVCLFMSIFAVSGINFDHFIKTNHVWEARFLNILISFTLAYGLSRFFIDIIELISI